MNPFHQMMARAAAARAANAAVPVPLGTWLMAASPLITEAMGHAGFAWGVVDMEHTPLDLAEVIAMLQAAAGTPMLPVVRVPSNDAVMIKRVLDAGAQTLMVPFVQNADEARAAVAAVRYPPEGTRGMAGMSRASRFGTAPGHFAQANQQVSVMLQLETPAAIAELEAIAAVPGVDALFIGPGDLSGAMGLPGQTGHADVMAAVAAAVQRANRVGCWIGTVGGSAEVVAEYRRFGFDFVAIASDLGLMMRAATGAVQSLGGGAQQTQVDGKGGY